MSKHRPVALGIAASALTIMLAPLSAGAASADVPPPNVQPPGVPFGLCSAVDVIAQSKDKCPDDPPSYEQQDDEDDEDDFPFKDDDGDDD